MQLKIVADASPVITQIAKAKMELEKLALAATNDALSSASEASHRLAEVAATCGHLTPVGVLARITALSRHIAIELKQIEALRARD